MDVHVANNVSATQRSNPGNDLFALDVLTSAGRIDEVLARGNTFLARPDLPLHLRHEVRGKQYDVNVQRRDWASDDFRP